MYKCQSAASVLFFVCLFVERSRCRSVPATPQCPQPCGDNVDDFCPNRLVLSAESRGMYNLSAPLTESDGWDIRVLHIDKSDTVKVPFMVSIYDEINYQKLLARDASAEPCKEDSALNKWVNCMSLQTKECRGHNMKVDGKEQYVPYTIAVITPNPETNLHILLRVRVDAAFMPDEECWSLGLPCSFWSTLFWLCFTAAVIYTIFRFRQQIS
ncbi:hypothetical protein GUITHDRAFT_150180, partial [Guillardia theta CCMP2712]